MEPRTSADQRRMERMVRNIWREMRGNIDRMPESVRSMMTVLSGEIVEFLAGADVDPDRRNKREVYIAVARFLADRTGLRAGACLAAVHELCRESDEALLHDAESDGREVRRAVDVARDLIVAIKVHYTVVSERQCQRQVELWSARDGKPTVTRITQEVDWEWLPPDVREHRLREGGRSVSFNLYTGREQP